MITSKQNQLVKLIRSLSDKKNRDIEGLYIAEGLNTVREALKANVQIRYIVLTERCLEKIGDVPADKLILVSQKVFDYLTCEVTPQGIMAIIEKNESPIESPSASCLFLDGVSDPANVGAIIRTAAASGYNQIYLADTADCYSPKSVRASMSGIFKIKVIKGSREQLLNAIDIPICIADMSGQSVYDVTMPDKFCLVIGNEARGVSEEVRNLAKISVSIPMENDMESLNASVSAGILMYILKRG